MDSGGDQRIRSNPSSPDHGGSMVGMGLAGVRPRRPPEWEEVGGKDVSWWEDWRLSSKIKSVLVFSLKL